MLSTYFVNNIKNTFVFNTTWYGVVIVIVVIVYIYILRQSINGDDYLSGAAQREQTKNL